MLGALALLVCVPTVAQAAPAGARIVNGVETHGHPTAGALLDASGNRLRGVCTGTLIGCRTFVTAAHCVCLNGTFGSCGQPNPARLKVYLQHGGLFDVAAVDVHPSYDFGETSDMAVLTLASSVDGVPPIPINTSATPPTETVGILVGFGVTNGFVDDAGLKREGMVRTAGCAGSVPEPAHVCWAFQNPLGPPGSNSNTCAGDSGGPLYVDLGDGLVLAGLTSGGERASCLPSDVSFDTNVYENRTFLEAVAGGDLATSSCGTISQVGDAETTITTRTSSTLDKVALRCRKVIAKEYLRYATTRLRILQRCFNKANKGAARGPCPDAATMARLTKAAAKVDPRKIAKRCQPGVVPASLPDGGCAGARNADDLAACIVATTDEAVDALLDAQYADETSARAITDRPLRRCQEAIAKTMGGYTRSRLRALVGCRNAEDSGRISGCPSGSVATKLAKLAAKIEPTIARRCTSSHIAVLQSDAFGGTCDTATNPSELASCQVADHDVAVDTLIGLLGAVGDSDSPSVEVAPGTALLRVTLNAIDDGADVDIYLRRGAPPTPSTFDFRSVGTGVFEAIEVPAPEGGTWFVLVDRVRGGGVRFQLTITTFQATSG